jgi:cellobiose phosphorylase
LLYYVTKQNENQYIELIKEKDKAYTLLLESALNNKQEKEAAWEGLFKEREKRINEQREMYERFINELQCRNK